MVKTNSSKDSLLMRKHMNTILDRFGQDMTRIAVTETTDQLGRLSDVSESTSSFRGDLQFMTKEEKNLLGYGHDVTGIAKLFCKHDQDMNIEDDILVDSQRWEIIKLVENPEMAGDPTFKMFVVQRRPETT